MTIEIVAIVTPKPEAVDQVGEVLNELAKSVMEKEPDALRFKPYKTVGANGNVEYVVLEKYADAAAIENHRASEHYKSATGRAQSEGLLAKPINGSKIEPLSEGFDSR